MPWREVLARLVVMPFVFISDLLAWEPWLRWVPRLLFTALWAVGLWRGGYPIAGVLADGALTVMFLLREALSAGDWDANPYICAAMACIPVCGMIVWFML